MIHGYLFPTYKAAADWYYRSNSMKAIWVSPVGAVWIGDNPGEGWAEMSAAELYKARGYGE